MTETDLGPVAVATPQPEPTAEVTATNGNGQPNNTLEPIPTFTGFDKIAAEARGNADAPPHRVRFGVDHFLHIHPEMPASFGLFLKGAGESDPLVIYDAVRSVIVTAEHAELDRILKLSPDAGGVTLAYIGLWLEQLSLFYGGVPLDER